MRNRKVRRKTHICPNCETVLERDENYCHICGQENHNLNVPMKDLIMEFIGSITFFEAKFIETARIIFTHPGKLTLDFNSGKRVKYMHPVRMYFLVSAIFFLTVNYNASKHIPTRKLPVIEKVSKSRDSSKNSEKKFGRNIPKTDSDKIVVGIFDRLTFSRDSVMYYHQLNDNQLDSVLDAKHVSNFFMIRKYIKNGIDKNYNFYIREKFGVEESIEKLIPFLSDLPNMMFILLPFAALILWLFERKTKWKFYFQHLVFTLNTHSAIFLMLIIAEILWELLRIIFKLNDKLNDKINDYDTFDNVQRSIVLLLSFIYFFISLKKVYQQNWGKTIVTFFLLTFTYALSFLVLFVVLTLSGLIVT